MREDAPFRAIAVPLVLVLACAGPGSVESPAEITGTWRAVLASPGGELPFTLEIQEAEGELTASVLNGDEVAPFSSVSVEGRSVLLEFDWYDSRLEAEVSEAGDSMTGRWWKTAAGSHVSTLPFTATRGDSRRFRPPDEAAGGAPHTIAGSWEAVFTEEDGSGDPARAEFEQDGSHVLGTFLTPTGDYRFLDGRMDEGHLKLSTFDGGHAFLFTATVAPDGSLVGDFWSRDTYHATWTARRIESEDVVLPDAWSLVGLTNEEGSFSFEFPDLEGQPMSLEDPRFEGKVVLVNIFGSWCPNCNDKAPLLAEWYREYRDRGLEIVGLAYEYTGDTDRDRQYVAKFRDRHGVEFPLLLAGTSDKKQAASTLPDLTAVVAFPTTVFIGRDRRVRRIHTGFSGPGTGQHYDTLITELRETIESLLDEQPG